MSSFYQSLLGIVLAVLALGIGVVAAAYQLVVTQVSATAARLTLRSFRLWGGVACLAIAAFITTAGSILLATPHDVISADLGTDRLLDNVITGFASVALLALGGLLIVWTGVRAVGLLDRTTAARRLADATPWAAITQWALGSMGDAELTDHDAKLAREGLDVDEMFAAIAMRRVSAATQNPGRDASDPVERELFRRLWRRKDQREEQLAKLRARIDAGKVHDPLTPFEELLDGAARAGRPFQVETIARDHIVRLRSTSAEVAGLSQAEQVRLVGSLVFEHHLLPLARRLADRGDFEAVGALIRAADRVEVDLASPWYFAAQTFAQKAALLLLRRSAAAPLCSALRTLASFATRTAGHRDAQGLFDNACLAIGSLGERIPATFYFPADPEVTLTPLDLDDEASDPLSCLIDSLEDIRSSVLDHGGDIDALVWRDAVAMSARAIEHRAGVVFADRRLETPLVRTMLLLADLGRRGARAGDERRAMYAAFSLGELAEDADRPFYHEYPRDIADALAEIGLFASIHDLKAPDGSPLLNWIATDLVQKLRPHLQASMHEVFVAGRYSPAPPDDRLGFIKRIAREATDNFGFRFDPDTGQGYRPEP